MADLITRCPGCLSSFNVSPAQLKSANGLVRCGSCQSEFDAHKHIIAKQIFGEKGLEEQTIDSDDMLIYDDMPLGEDSSDDTGFEAAESGAEEKQGTVNPPLETPPTGENAEQGQTWEEGERLTAPAPQILIEEPVLLAQAKAKPPQLIFIPFVILLMLLLPLQYAHFNASQLAEHEATFPYIKKLCDITGCQVFSRDLEQLQIANLRVATHSDQLGALQISGKLVNKAAFQQPLPLLELQFESLEAKVVANRFFTPEEYLQGVLPARGVIPKKRSLLFKLEIVDPGKAAQSYSFVLH